MILGISLFWACYIALAFYGWYREGISINALVHYAVGVICMNIWIAVQVLQG